MTTRGHILLLGDSIFDNRAYTGGEPDVVTHLRSLLPETWQATLRAVDGTTTHDVWRQFPAIPADATHLVLSLGGNDALLNSDLLGLPVESSAEALRHFAARLDAFEAAYRGVVEALATRRQRLTVCTIYNGALDPATAPLARVALMMFNDVIVRSALGYQAAVIELRHVCTEPADYANPIEPSGAGGQKIARAVARAVGVMPGGVTSRLFAG